MLFLKEIHNVLNLNVDIIALNLFLCTNFFPSVLKPELSHHVFSVISGCLKQCWML